MIELYLVREATGEMSAVGNMSEFEDMLLDWEKVTMLEHIPIDVLNGIDTEFRVVWVES